MPDAQHGAAGTPSFPGRQRASTHSHLALERSGEPTLALGVEGGKAVEGAVTFGRRRGSNEQAFSTTGSGVTDVKNIHSQDVVFLFLKRVKNKNFKTNRDTLRYCVTLRGQAR